jgi:hypothetical protein
MAVMESVEHGRCAKCGGPVLHWVKWSLRGEFLTRRTEHIADRADSVEPVAAIGDPNEAVYAV